MKNSYCKGAVTVADNATWLAGIAAAPQFRRMAAERELSISEQKSTLALNDFLAGIEKRAFTIANIATRSREDALDIVQDTMLALVANYRDKPAEQWRPLFYRILHNKINDCHRKRSRRSIFHRWLDSSADQTEHEAACDSADETAGPGQNLENGQTMSRIESALANLPARQQQAFLMREWEGLSVRETASAMGCSEGSVKTHLSRALASMRKEMSSGK